DGRHFPCAIDGGLCTADLRGVDVGPLLILLGIRLVFPVGRLPASRLRRLCGGRRAGCWMLSLNTS
ncbi:MAG: hypothetical protein AB8H12_21905, partial [Lewinella sp.]